VNGSPVYRVVMTQRDRDELLNRSRASNVLLPITFIAEGNVWYVVGLRYRGETARNETHRSYRINFVSELLFDGVEHLNLCGSNGGNLGTGNVRELLAQDMFHRAGAPTR